MKSRENLPKKQIIEKLLSRQEFLLSEMYAADRLDGWNLKGITDELKGIRVKLNTLEEDTDKEENS
jgi:hypothetical protein